MDHEEKNRELAKWKPKISVKKVAQAINDVVDTGKQLIENTLNDINEILGGIENCIRTCGRELDDIRLRLIHRGIQYISTTLRTICVNGLIAGDVIEEVYNKISGEIRHFPEPKILHLQNPRSSVWPDENGQVAKPIFVEIDPREFVYNEDTEAWVFIHGNLYKGIKKDGSDFSSEKQDDVFDFFTFFEKEAQVFHPESKCDTETINIYLISYDSEMRDEDERTIKNALKSYILGGENFHLLMAAVFWREMELRAEETAVHIRPFLEKLETNRGRAITHSLGCYVLAYASQMMNDNTSPQAETNIVSFKSWWCMSAALPSSAFSNTGSFKYAPLIAGSWRTGLIEGTSVWYSLGDNVLILLYPLATCTTALGFTGLGVNDSEWAEDYDITSITGVYHGLKGEYIKALGPKIREVLHLYRCD
ncbi:MAG: hypothetical protein ACQEWW_26490 [Bacillota bacterium]